MEAAPRIRWRTLDELDESLRDFERRYAAAEASPEQRRDLRNIVIQAKDRTRFASRNPKVSAEKRAEKEEMLRWMLVWLDDPSMFADWVTLRRRDMRR